MEAVRWKEGGNFLLRLPNQGRLRVRDTWDESCREVEVRGGPPPLGGRQGCWGWESRRRTRPAATAGCAGGLVPRVFSGIIAAEAAGGAPCSCLRCCKLRREPLRTPPAACSQWSYSWPHPADAHRSQESQRQLAPSPLCYPPPAQPLPDLRSKRRRHCPTAPCGGGEKRWTRKLSCRWGHMTRVLGSAVCSAVCTLASCSDLRPSSRVMCVPPRPSPPLLLVCLPACPQQPLTPTPTHPCRPPSPRPLTRPCRSWMQPSAAAWTCWAARPTLRRPSCWPRIGWWLLLPRWAKGWGWRHGWILGGWLDLGWMASWAAVCNAAPHRCCCLGLVPPGSAHTAHSGLPCFTLAACHHHEPCP